MDLRTLSSKRECRTFLAPLRAWREKVVNKDGLKFVSAMVWFLWMKEEQLGFNPTIVTVGDKRYIKIEQGRKKACLGIDKVINRVRCVADRAACWRVHQEKYRSSPLCNRGLTAMPRA